MHPAQEDEVQPPHPELPREPSEDRPVPNRERRLVVFFEPQSGQRTSGCWPKTSFSKQCLQESH